MSKLPTADEMLARAEADMTRAYTLLRDATDWLRSDWRPVGSALTDEQAARRDALRRGIEQAKHAINEAKGQR